MEKRMDDKKNIKCGQGYAKFHDDGSISFASCYIFGIKCMLRPNSSARNEKDPNLLFYLGKDVSEDHPIIRAWYDAKNEWLRQHKAEKEGSPQQVAAEIDGL